MPSIDSITAPPIFRDFSALGALLSDMEGLAAINVGGQDVRHAIRVAQLELLAETTKFVSDNPSIGEYYDAAIVAGEEAIGENLYYEALLFRDIFVADTADSEPGPEPSLEILYIDDKEFTRDEALILFTELLLSSNAPLRAEELRELGLGPHMSDESGKHSPSVFAQLRKLMGDSLEATLNGSHYFEEIGEARGKRYALRLGGLVVRKVLNDGTSVEVEDIEIVLDQLPLKSKNGTKKSTKRNVVELDAQNTTIPAAPTLPVQATPEPTPAPGPEVTVAVEPTIEIIIRGIPHEFTVTQKSALDALLAGNSRVQAIVAHMRGGVNYADPDDFAKNILPALDNLCARDVGGGQRLASRKTVYGGGMPHQEYFLADGARLDPRPRTSQIFLRLYDPSLPSLAKAARRRDRANQPSVSEPTPAAIQEPARSLKPEKPSTTPSKPAVLKGDILTTSNGTTIKLEAKTRDLLHAMRSGERFVLSDLVQALGGESDPTINGVISTELFELQRLLGSTVLRRKQKQGQLARWWLVPGTISYETETAA